jgi:hypothetical protein
MNKRSDIEKIRTYLFAQDLLYIGFCLIIELVEKSRKFFF